MTDKQKQILEKLKEVELKPKYTHAQIAELVNVCRSYVSRVAGDHLTDSSQDVTI